MIYCPYVLIKLFQQSNSEADRERREREEREGERERGVSEYKWDIRLKRAGNCKGSSDKYIGIYTDKDQWLQQKGLKWKLKCKGMKQVWAAGLMQIHPTLTLCLDFHLLYCPNVLLHLHISFIFPVSCYSQLDYNHISCIEDGAFRALRDLEVL